MKKPCQCCLKNDRNKVVIYNGMLHFLCTECSDRPSSKFYKAEDLTSKYDLNSTRLNDIPTDKAFVFQTVATENMYMFVPNLPSSHSHRQVLDLKTMQIRKLVDDAEIKIVNIDFQKAIQ